MQTRLNRRAFLKGGLLAGSALLVPGLARARARQFEISVAGWSLHREIFGGKLTAKQAFRVVREEFDLGAFELVNTLLEVPTASYVDALRKESETFEVVVPLIMCDAEGHLGDEDMPRRDRAVRDHLKWIYIASDLGCHAIRVNWSGLPREKWHDAAAVDAFVERSADSFDRLVELGKVNGIDILVENHGGFSGYPEHLARLMKTVDSPHFGTLPDFGNFPDGVDRYAAVDQLMPWAKSVSAKCWEFGGDGNETTLDFERLMRICVDQHGFSGYIGIEYEGRGEEREGVIACRDLLLRLRAGQGT